MKEEKERKKPDPQHKRERELMDIRKHAPNRAIHKTMSASDKAQALAYRKQSGYITPDSAEPQEGTEGKATDGQFLKWFVELANLPPINADDPQELAERCAYYFNFCSARGIRAGFEGLCNAIGINMVTMREWENGKCGPDKANVIQKARGIIANSLENLGQTGKINPVTFIFLTKNHLGYRDQTEHTINQQINIDMSNIGSISNRLPVSDADEDAQGKTVDVNFTEITNNSKSEIDNTGKSVD